jgi:hypothetical protein
VNGEWALELRPHLRDPRCWTQFRIFHSDQSPSRYGPCLPRPAVPCQHPCWTDEVQNPNFTGLILLIILLISYAGNLKLTARTKTYFSIRKLSSDKGFSGAPLLIRLRTLWLQPL